MHTKLSLSEIRADLNIISSTCTINPLSNDDQSKLIKDNSFPVKFVDLWLPDFVDVVKENVILKMQAWLNNLVVGVDNDWIMLCGPIGVCKTALATMMLKYSYCIMRNKKIRAMWQQQNPLVQDWNLVRFWSSYDVVKEHINNKDRFEGGKRAFILAIDDITKPSNDFYTEVLDQVLRYRELNCLPTILTSQVKSVGLGDTFPLPLCDLINGNSDEVRITGDSKRG